MTPPATPSGPTGDAPTPTPGEARTAGLQRAAQARTARAESAANAAIHDLIKRGATINFAAVARVAGVTPAFLHRHPELSSRIRGLSRQQAEVLHAQHDAGPSGEAAVIVALRRRLKEQDVARATQVSQLRAQIKALEQQVAALYGRMG